MTRLTFATYYVQTRTVHSLIPHLLFLLLIILFIFCVVFTRVAAHFWHMQLMRALLFKYIFFLSLTPQKSTWRYPPEPWVHLCFSCTVRVPNMHISPSAHLNTGLSLVVGMGGGGWHDEVNTSTARAQRRYDSFCNSNRCDISYKWFLMFVLTRIECQIYHLYCKTRRIFRNDYLTHGHHWNNFRNFYTSVKLRFGLLLRITVIKITRKYI